MVPLLQFCVLCDSIAQSPDGKPTFVGVFDGLKKPGTVPQFSIALRWCNGLGKFKTTLRLLRPNLEELIPRMENEFELRNRVQNATGYFVLVNLQFSESGVYWMEISLDDEIAASVPFSVFS